MIKWKKKGLIFQYTSELIGTKSHCQYPCPIQLDGDIYRVFYGSRDNNNNTIIFYFDINLKSLEVINTPKEPIIKNGKIGHFDANGIYPSCVLKNKEQFLMYTLGFMRGEPPLYYTRIGLATSKDCSQFKKYSEAPIMNTSDHDPWMLTGPFVLKEGELFRMWYVSGNGWDEEMNSYYHIKYAESKNGVDWHREGLISIDYAYSDETNIARPWIIKENNVYKAFFSYSRGKQGYRIGYAESHDGGYKFERKDQEVNLNISERWFENDSIAYPAVIIHNNLKYIFYNGDNFGKHGIALAIENKN